MFRLRGLMLSFLLVLVACAALIWFIVDRDMRGLEARVQGRSQLLRSSFGVIEYASVGEGHTVLVIHGSVTPQSVVRMNRVVWKARSPTGLHRDIRNAAAPVVITAAADQKRPI